MQKQPEIPEWARIHAITEAEGFAIKALAGGTANKEQQLRAFEFILQRVCRVDEMSFSTGVDGDRITAFAEGRRFVGRALRELERLPEKKLRKED